MMLSSSIGILSPVWAANRETGPQGSEQSAAARPVSLSKPITKPGLKLTQISRNHGKYEIYVCPTSLRVVNEPTQCVFVWSSPESTLWIMNTETKRYYSEPLEKWYESGLMSLSIVGKGPQKADPASLTVTNVKFEDMDCHQTSYKVMPDKRDLSDTTAVTDKTSPVHATSTRVRHTGVVLTSLASRNYRTQGRILCVLYNIPTSDEIPLRYVGGTTGREAFLLQTKSVVHEPIPSTLAMPPKGFVRAKNLDDALVSLSKKHDFENLMQDLNVGEDFGTKAH
jgi:hypothetical protein